jgi:hypothetical protein
MDGGSSDAGEDAPGTYDGPPLGMSCFKNNFGVTINFGDDGGESVTPSAADASASADGAAAGDAAVNYPGTTGKPCKSDADCKGNICELTDPTPVCVPYVDPSLGGNCDPGTDGAFHFCDGPDTPTSPGVCFPAGNGLGLCLPACSFTDGRAITGCTGNNACSPFTFGMVNGQPVGIGICRGGCMVDSDCQGSNNKCLVQFGLCNNEQVPAGTASCNCLVGSGAGFCSQACVVSGSGVCPTGTVCEAFEPTGAGFTTQSPGLNGLCLPSCPGGACPSPAQCVDPSSATGTVAGPDCQP